MKPLILYAAHRDGGTMATFGWACSRCRTPYANDGVQNARELADRCCGREVDRQPIKSESRVDGDWMDVLLDGLPADLERVLIYDPTAPWPTNIGYLRRGTWYVDGSSRRWAPTHWRPLTPPGGA